MKSCFRLALALASALAHRSSFTSMTIIFFPHPTQFVGTWPVGWHVKIRDTRVGITMIEAGSRVAIHSGAVSILETKICRLRRRYIEGGRQGVSPGRQISADVMSADPAAAEMSTPVSPDWQGLPTAHRTQWVQREIH
ncbi:hypothetical protein C8R44DRAFT_732048 [Mycena epipterygia]|nr:hypothetical protein C8R44DRAFT_732048 [Mycena epipterygia]